MRGSRNSRNGMLRGPCWCNTESGLDWSEWWFCVSWGQARWRFMRVAPEVWREAWQSCSVGWRLEGCCGCGLRVRRGVQRMEGRIERFGHRVSAASCRTSKGRICVLVDGCCAELVLLSIVGGFQGSRSCAGECGNMQARFGSSFDPRRASASRRQESAVEKERGEFGWSGSNRWLGRGEDWQQSCWTRFGISHRVSQVMLFLQKK